MQQYLKRSQKSELTSEKQKWRQNGLSQSHGMPPNRFCIWYEFLSKQIGSFSQRSLQNCNPVKSKLAIFFLSRNPSKKDRTKVGQTYTCLNSSSLSIPKIIPFLTDLDFHVQCRGWTSYLLVSIIFGKDRSRTEGENTFNFESASRRTQHFQQRMT